MARFKYKMQNILELKKKLEEQQEMALVAARLNLSDEEDKLESLYARKKNYEETLRESCKNKLNINAIKLETSAYESMDYFIGLQKIEVKKAEGKVELEQNKMREAMKERKTQEKLREKAFNNYLKELATEEVDTVDELVAYKYGSDIDEEEWKIDG